MPTPTDGQGNDYKANKDTKNKSFIESTNQEGPNNGNHKGMDEASINDSTITMSLAGSISLGKRYFILDKTAYFTIYQHNLKEIDRRTCNYEYIFSYRIRRRRKRNI